MPDLFGARQYSDDEINEMHKERARQREMAFSRETLSRGKKTTPANQLTEDLIKYIIRRGGAARRVNNQGQWDEEKFRWRPSGMRRGFEDVDACMNILVKGIMFGLKVGVEVKIKGDSLSDDQLKRKDELIKSGGRYMVAKTFDQFKQDWEIMKEKATKYLNHAT